MFDDDFEKEKRKLVFEEVARVMREHPKNYLEKLAELGFRWVDDEVDEEEIEEKAATIRSDNERYLVGYAASAFALDAARREELRRQVIHQYGEELELIAPSKETRNSARRQRKKRKKKGGR